MSLEISYILIYVVKLEGLPYVLESLVMVHNQLWTCVLMGAL